MPLDLKDEPLLDLDDIQGNIVPGFSKDHQILKFLSISDVPRARSTLAPLVGDIATSREVGAYAKLRTDLRERRGGAATGLSARWANVALSYSGISKLADPTAADALDQGAFKAGLANRSALLGDPIDPTTPGHPSSWQIGRPGMPPIDVLVILAGDREDALRNYSEIWDAKLGIGARSKGDRGFIQILPDLVGATLGGNLNGHEHFGFKDGISQPGIRGRDKANPSELITPRLIDPASSLASLYGTPGQALVWPGEFLLGLARQDGFDSEISLPAITVNPAWLANGSFLVLRLLQQDVAGFWKAMREYAYQVLGDTSSDAVNWVAARCVGRWRSGTPVTCSPDRDRTAFSQDDRIINNFQFREAGVVPPLVAGQPRRTPLPGSLADPTGSICPYAAHLRKVNPRDDPTSQGGPADTLTRRILRRGIPYGPAARNPEKARARGPQRGLIFISYQASIEDQFEFLMQQWVNGDDSPHEGGGRDAVLGRHAAQGQLGPTTIGFTKRDTQPLRAVQMSDFIVPQGGGYFFAPSIAALKAMTIPQG